MEAHQETRNTTTIWSRYTPLLDINLKESKSAYIKYFCTPMFIVVLFRIAKLWYQPSTNEWIKKMWYIYTGYYSKIENREVMSFSGKWMELEIIILNELSQMQKDKYHLFSYMWDLYFKKKTWNLKGDWLLGKRRGAIGRGL
jgi:hypothetical protein